MDHLDTETHDDKLTLTQLRRLRFPRRNLRGEVIWTDRFHWEPTSERVPWVAWVLHFDVQRWEWGISLAPEKHQDLEWTESEYIVLWLHNYDPNRFLVGIQIETVHDLLRFLDAFKVEYYFITAEEVKPVDYLGMVK